MLLMIIRALLFAKKWTFEVCTLLLQKKKGIFFSSIDIYSEKHSYTSHSMMKMIQLLHTYTLVEQQQSPAVPDFKGNTSRVYQNLCAPSLLSKRKTTLIFKAEVIGHLPAYLHCLTLCYNYFFLWLPRCICTRCNRYPWFFFWVKGCVPSEAISVALCGNSTDFLLFGIHPGLSFKEFLMNFYHVRMKCYSTY